MAMHRRITAAGCLVVAAVLLLAGAAWYNGGRLISPSHASVGSPPGWFVGEHVAFASDSGATISGWYLPVPGADASVVLLHGVRANRRSMLRRARFLSEAGCSVLLVDLQAHGESAGEHISFGHLESRDARAAVGFLRSRTSGGPVLLLGTSLGGAAAVLADPPVAVDGLILEAVFPSIEKAVENRLRIRAGVLGPALAPALVWQLKPRLGIDAAQLQPIEAARAVTSDVFIISGDADRRTTVADTQAFYDAFRSRKQLWLVPGAKHQDLHRFAGEEYERRVLEFIRAVVGRAA